MSRNIWAAIGVVVLVAVGAGVVAQSTPESTAEEVSLVPSFPDPTPGPSHPVREQNLDPNGLIAVHEQGVAAVDVTNNSLTVQGTVTVDQVQSEVDVHVNGGSVDVANEVDVNVTGGMLDEIKTPSVTQIESHLFTPHASESELITFATLDATYMSILTEDSEVYVFARGPLGEMLRIDNEDGSRFHYSQAFTFPMPINEVEVLCRNESETCFVSFNLAGF